MPRTVVDLARVSSFMSAVVTADSALREGLTTKGALLAVCDACPRWPGIRQAGASSTSATRELNRRLSHVPGWFSTSMAWRHPELQFTVTGPDFRYSVDFYWPRHRVIAEADGAIKYSDQRAAIRQLRRDQQLRDLGYKVVHFTWRELFQDQAAVVARIRKAFASPPPSKPGGEGQCGEGGAATVCARSAHRGDAGSRHAVCARSAHRGVWGVVPPQRKTRTAPGRVPKALEQAEACSSATAPPLSLRRRGHCVASKSTADGGTAWRSAAAHRHDTRLRIPKQVGKFADRPQNKRARP